MTADIAQKAAMPTGVARRFGGAMPRGVARRFGRAAAGVILAAGVLAAGVLAACANPAGDGSAGPPAPEADVTGFTDFRESNPKWLTQKHRTGSLAYRMSPPVGGDHSPFWQNCNGDVYDAPIASEHAVHSLEHGAVWVTYRPGLPDDQVEALAARVRDRSYMFMSPYADLDAPISIQAWGYQLKVASAADKSIDDFVTSYRVSASLEPGAPCSGGVTSTGTKPVNP